MRAVNFTPRKCTDTKSLNIVLSVAHPPLKPIYKPHLRILVLDFTSAILMPSVLCHSRIITEASNLIYKLSSNTAHLSFPQIYSSPLFFVFIFIAIIVTPAMKPRHPVFDLPLASFPHLNNCRLILPPWYRSHSAPHPFPSPISSLLF